MDSAQVKSILKSVGVTARKGRGQNFLCDESGIDEIISFAAIRPEDSVLEIGPGLGAITKHLAARAKKLLVVELEAKFCKYLQKSIPELEPDAIVQNSIFDMPLDTIVDKLGDRFVVVSNVPYSISTDVLRWIINARQHVTRASLLLQQGFAERVAANPGSRAYGSLTVYRSMFADAELGAKIKGSAFYPTTAVDSQLLGLFMSDQPRDDGLSLKVFEDVLEASFVMKRKTLMNNLLRSQYFESREEVEACLSGLNIDPSRRAETLTLEEFKAMTDYVAKNCST